MTLVVPPVNDLLRRARTADGTAAGQPMFPTIIAIRNDRVVAVVSSSRMEATLSCAETLAIGTAPQALVVAAEATIEDRPVLAYTLMTRERQAKTALQEIHQDHGAVTFSVPFDAGSPEDETVLRTLAQAISQQPMDVTKVSRKDLSGTFGEDHFMAPEEGRVVVDAGTISTLQKRVEGIGGRALYVARSREAGKLALQAGLPRTSLLSE